MFWSRVILVVLYSTKIGVLFPPPSFANSEGKIGPHANLNPETTAARRFLIHLPSCWSSDITSSLFPFFDGLYAIPSLQDRESSHCWLKLCHDYRLGLVEMCLLWTASDILDKSNACGRDSLDRWDKNDYLFRLSSWHTDHMNHKMSSLILVIHTATRTYILSKNLNFSCTIPTPKLRHPQSGCQN